MGRGGGHSGGGHSGGGHSGGGHRSGGGRSGGFGGRGGGGGFSGPRVGGIGGGFGSRNRHHSGGIGPRHGIGPRRHYYSGPRGYRRSGGGMGGCLSAIAFVFIIVVLYVILSFSSCSNSGLFQLSNTNYIDEEVAAEYTSDLFEDKFTSDDYGMVLSITEYNDWDDEYDYIEYSDNTSDIMIEYLDTYWKYFDQFYNDDVAYQVGKSLSVLAQQIRTDNVTPYDNPKECKKNFFNDYVNAFDTTTTLRLGIEDFYNATGIQVYVVAVDYDSYVDNYVETSTTATQIVIVFLVCVAVIVIVILLIKWWKAKKKQKNIEDENTIRILNTPLEEFGDLDLENTAKKYDSDNDNE